MNIIEAMRKAREQDVGITNPELTTSGIFLYALYNDAFLEVRRMSDGFEGPDGMLIPDWRPTPEELFADDWELYSEGKEIEPEDNAESQPGPCPIGEGVPVHCGESVRPPQMSEEKKNLVDMLLKYIEDKTEYFNNYGYSNDDPTVGTLVDIAKVVAGLVN